MTIEAIVRPGRLRQFGESAGASFWLVTNPSIADRIAIEHDADYVEYRTALLQPGQKFEDLLRAEIPENTHILSISPDAFFKSPAPDVLGPRRKLLGMACNSTPTPLEAIVHFLNAIEKTSPEEQDAFAERFFELLESTTYLEYVDERRKTRATLDHANPELVWNQQAGALQWGDQQIVPPGEISVLPIEIFSFDANLRLPFEGELTLCGHPILHNTPSFSRAEQARIYDRLAPMKKHPVVATVVNGLITALRSFDAEGASVAGMLEAMFAMDSRYRNVWEMGHALNTSLDILDGNHAMNETYGGTKGCMHWGFGITPYTQYHLDIITPDTTVYTSDGRVVLGTGADRSRSSKK